MKKILARYLGNVLWLLLHYNTKEIEAVDEKWILTVITEIQDRETDLIKLGMSEQGITRLLKMCEKIHQAWVEQNPALPIPYQIKIQKLIFSTPIKKELVKK